MTRDEAASHDERSVDDTSGSLMTAGPAREGKLLGRIRIAKPAERQEREYDASRERSERKQHPTYTYWRLRRPNPSRVVVNGVCE